MQVPAYTAALSVLDGDMPQYIHDNTDDEDSHQKFLNAFLESIGAEPVDLEPFRTLPGSQASGADPNKKTADQSHAADRRHELVHTVPGHRESRFW
jgi:hypothetical protein